MTPSTRTCAVLLALVVPWGLTGCSDDSKQFERAVPAPASATSAAATASSSAGATPRASSTASRDAGPSVTTQQPVATAQTTITVQASSDSGTGGTGSQGQASDGGTWYRSSSGLYRSRQKVCVEFEERWQAAVKAGKKSASVKAHDDAIMAGCDPAVWTPEGAKHATVHESHYDGESCSKSEAGTVAVFDDTYAVCTQQVEDQWTWEVAER